MYLYIELLVIEGPAPALLVRASRAGGATRARERVCVCRNTEGLPPSERADGMQRLSFPDPNFQRRLPFAAHRVLLSALDASVTAAG